MSTEAPTVALEAGFIEGPASRMFVLRLLPAEFGPERAGAPSAHALIVPPFAEEMNRSRRFMVRLARSLASHGVAASIPDLYGTGDSTGDFSEATWERWLDELRQLRALEDGRDAGPLILIGLRTGALLAAESLAREPEGVARLVCLQAVAKGDVFLNQLLRVRVAASMARGRKETTKGLRAQLDGGETLEVAGYRLNPTLARALASRRLDAIDLTGGPPITWYELVSPSAQDLPSPAPPATWPGEALTVRQLRAEPFWSLQEPVVPAAVIDAVCQDLRSGP